MKIVAEASLNLQDASTELPSSNAAGKQTPRRMRRAAEIVAAARDVFLEKGFESASVSEIAAKVGVVEGLLYSYFPTKRDLLNEVLCGMYEPLIKEMNDGFNRLNGLRSRLRFLIWRHIRVYVEEPGLSRLVLHEVRTRPEYFNSALHGLHVRYTAFVMWTLRDAIASGELPSDTDEEMVRGMIYGGIEHRMWAVLFGRGTVNVEVAADRFTDMVLRGIQIPQAVQAFHALTALASSPTPLGQKTSPTDLADVERRLQRLEKIVAASSLPMAEPHAANTSTAATAANAATAAIAATATAAATSTITTKVKRIGKPSLSPRRKNIK